MSVSSRHKYIVAIAAIAMIAAGGAAYAGGGPDGAKKRSSSGHHMNKGQMNKHRMKTPRPNFQPRARGPNLPRANFQPQVYMPQKAPRPHYQPQGHPPQKGPRPDFQPKPQPVKGPRPNFAPTIIVPSVNVRAPNLVINQGSVSVASNTFFFGGSSFGSSGGFVNSVGGFAAPSTPVAPTALNGLNVTGADQTVTETITEQVPVTEETCAPQFTQSVVVRPVQAVCIDDKGTPHPASRVSAEKTIADGFQGEVFRCLAGTHMQVTLGQVHNGQASFAQAETFSCRKGEALVHTAGGQLTCAPQTPQRNCNERSLLRRHGPGIKLVRAVVKQQTCVPQQRTTYKTVTKEVQRTVAAEPGSLVLDGGVGQGVF